LFALPGRPLPVGGLLLALPRHRVPPRDRLAFLLLELVHASGNFGGFLTTWRLLRRGGAAGREEAGEGDELPHPRAILRAFRTLDSRTHAARVTPPGGPLGSRNRGRLPGEGPQPLRAHDPRRRSRPPDAQGRAAARQVRQQGAGHGAARDRGREGALRRGRRQHGARVPGRDAPAGHQALTSRTVSLFAVDLEVAARAWRDAPLAAASPRGRVAALAPAGGDRPAAAHAEARALYAAWVEDSAVAAVFDAPTDVIAELAAALDLPPLDGAPPAGPAELGAVRDAAGVEVHDEHAPVVRL